MGNPVVVQGTPVTQQQAFGSALEMTSPAVPYGGGSSSSSGVPQGKKESGCNDVLFAVLFYAAVVAVVAVAVLKGPDALNNSAGSNANSSNSNSNNHSYDYKGYVEFSGIVAIVSFFGAGAGMALLMCIPQFLIKAALIFVVAMAGVMAFLSFAGGSIVGGVIGLIFFAISICYACAVWSRIPFATANLVTACTAIKSNMGVTVYAYFFAILAGAWSAVWTLAFVGVFDATYCSSTTTSSSNNQVCSPSYGLIFLLFLAFFFVQQVFQNSIHVTVAGTVATWWYAPEECGCCASAVNNSFLRTVTTSFGSICFGSLLVAILQALRTLANQAKQNGEGGIEILFCIAECILNCLASIVEYFNKWAFVYVGIYGMPYCKAGKSVFELFRNRGWEAVIADDLVGNVLFLISLLVGGVMGGIGVLIDILGSIFQDAGGDTKAIAFLIGFIIGLVITSILMSTIASGVNTIIVLFAEAPNEFHQNHRQLSDKMREVWNQVYPGSI